MQCSVHKTLFTLTSRSVVLEPTGNNNVHIIKFKAHSGLVIKRAR